MKNEKKYIGFINLRSWYALQKKMHIYSSHKNLDD